MGNLQRETCKSSSKLLLERPSPLRSRAPTQSMPSRPRSRTRRASLQTSSASSLQASSSRMVVPSRTTISRKSLLCVSTSEVAIIEKCGKFDREGHAGCNVLNPCLCESVAHTVSTRVELLSLLAVTKTQDDVFVKMGVQVNTRVRKPEMAYYNLADPSSQISAYVEDSVRAMVPSMKLDEVFEKKDLVANRVKQDLDEHLEEYGYEIISALVTEVEPEHTVKDAMNRKNAAVRLRQAAVDESEAEKIKVVKQAEAHADAAALAGSGVARQRKEIVDGLRDAVKEFGQSIEGTSSREVMNIVLMTQYFDTLKEIGGSGRCSTIFVPTAPSSVGNASGEFMQSMLNANMQANAVKLS